MRSRIVQGGPYIGFAVFAAVFGLPVYWILLSAFLPPSQTLSQPPTYFTTQPTLATMERAVEQLPLWQYATNSLIFAAGSSLLSIALAFFAAYAFARLRFRSSGVAMFGLLMTMALPQIAITIPLFRVYNELGLVDTLRGLVLLQASILLPLTVWLFVSFIKQIPVELEHAAFVDGANFVQMIYLVMFPLMRPAFVTLFLLNFITAWNELFYPLVFSSTDASRTMTVGLVQLTQVTGGTGGRPWDLMAALATFMIIPIILLVATGQRRIIAGLTAGSTK